MSQFGKEPDPTKGGAGGAQDCDACGNRDHVQISKRPAQEITGTRRRQTCQAQPSLQLTELVAMISMAASSGRDGAQMNAQRKCPANVNNGLRKHPLKTHVKAFIDWGEFGMDNNEGSFRMEETAEVA